MVTIYGLIDKGEVFYIGKTKDLDKRLKQHISKSFLKITEKDMRIQAMLSAGIELSAKVLETCDEHLADVIEQKYIDNYTSLITNTIYAHRVKLTRIEHQILLMLSQDRDTAEIAQLLFKSARTIEGHRYHLKIKSGTKTVAGLIMWGVNNGYIVT